MTTTVREKPIIFDADPNQPNSRDQQRDHQYITCRRIIDGVPITFAGHPDDVALRLEQVGLPPPPRERTSVI